MANETVSAMPLVGAALGTDYFPVVQAGGNFRETITQVFSLLQTTAGLVFTQQIKFGGGAFTISAAGVTTIVSGLNQITLDPTDASVTGLNFDVGGTAQDGVIQVFETGLNVDVRIEAVNTVGGKISVNDTAGFPQIVITGSSTPTIDVGNAAGAAQGTVNVYDGGGNLAAVLSGGGIGVRVKAIAGDMEVFTTGGGSGYILNSPDGTRWRITVDNAGQISTNPA